MQLPRNAALTASLLAASMLLNVTLVSCGAEPTAPPAQTAEILEKLAEVTSKLAQIEAKLDAQGTATAERLDSLEVTVTAAASGAVPLAGIDAARVDSLLALSSWIAHDISSGGFEMCLKHEIGMKGGFTVGGDVEGEAVGSLGAWAGTGAFAGAKVKLKSALEGGIEGGFPFEFGHCAPIFGDDPPARVASSRAAARATVHLQSSMSGLATQLGFSESSIESALSNLASAVQSTAMIQPQDVAAMIPLPPAISSRLANPGAALKSQVDARVGEAVDLLCTGSWGSAVSTPISSACATISSGPPDIGGLFTMMQQFPAVQTTLTRVNGISTTMCGRLNTIGFFSLTIPNPLAIGPPNLFGPQRLFPWYTTIGC
jgi:hypothetical protein